MSFDLSTLPASPGYAITTALLAAIRDDEVLGNLRLVRNPRRPNQLGDEEVVLVLAERGDDLTAAPGDAENRQRQVSVGVIVRGQANDDAAEALADRVYHRLHNTCHTALQQIQPAALTVNRIKESGRTFQVDDLDVDGALVMGGWTVDYRYRRPRAPA